jgi:hypothetical protein
MIPTTPIPSTSHYQLQLTPERFSETISSQIDNSVLYTPADPYGYLFAFPHPPLVPDAITMEMDEHQRHPLALSSNMITDVGHLINGDGSFSGSESIWTSQYLSGGGGGNVYHCPELGYGISPITYGLGDAYASNSPNFVQGTTTLLNCNAGYPHSETGPLDNTNIDLNHYGGFINFFENEDVDVDVDFTLLH